LKDAEWFWTNGNGLTLRVLGAEEAIETVRRGYGHPAYVPLEVLASRTLRRLDFSALEVGETLRIHGWRVQTFALNHYSGGGRHKNRLDTLGYLLRSPQGFVVAYLCDHEPSAETAADEERMLEGAHLALIDAHFADRISTPAATALRSTPPRSRGGIQNASPRRASQARPTTAIGTSSAPRRRQALQLPGRGRGMRVSPDRTNLGPRRASAEKTIGR
jgi:hypothetical protein